jgi:cell division protease FtsH
MIEIPLPDVPDLVGIFRDYLGAQLADATLLDVALAAFGGTGADVERWVREARATARRSGRDLSKDDLLRVVRGSKGELPPLVRRRVAYHEAGHAIATVATGLGRPVSLSIGGGGGLSQSEPGERRALTRAHIETHLMILLAGRAAEILIFGEATAGSGGADNSDLARATWLAERLETVYGLGGSGLVYMPAEGHRLLLDASLRKGIEKTLDRVQAATCELLARNRGCLDALASALYEKGYMSADEIGRLLEKVPPQAWAHAASGPPKAAAAPSEERKHEDLGVEAQP